MKAVLTKEQGGLICRERFSLLLQVEQPVFLWWGFGKRSVEQK